MRSFGTGIRCFAGLLAILAVLSCSTGQRPEPTAPISPTATYTDPFAYCAAVGTIDAPDARYVGPPTPIVIAEGLRTAFGMPATAPLEPFIRGTFWRCMNGKVFACTVGANLPCMEKANTSRTPTPAMAEFCKTRPEADVIPAVVTGRATVYLWRCSQGKPDVVRQVSRPDAQGFLANIWYQISS